MDPAAGHQTCLCACSQCPFEVTVVQAVILAAGRGSRLEPVTHHISKPLIPFWGRPFITHLLENLEGFVDEVIIVDGPEQEIEAVLGDSHESLPLRYAVQHDPLGTGDALLRARDMLDDPFIMMLGDTCPPPATIRELIEASGDAVLTTVRVDDIENHGGVAIDNHGRVTALWTDDETVDAGMIRMTSHVCDLLETLEPFRGELRILQGINAMIEAGDDVRGIVMPGPWLQFGDHEHLDGVLRVMRQIRNGEASEEQFEGSCVEVAESRDCMIRNSLVFGPGELVNCTITDSMVYCATRLEGVQIHGEMTAYGGHEGSDSD
ncbi:MAG: NTP transferase domain-containing protein [Armatimonadia bacterium]|nr:NTP transferase domain-containing protein [Armatimonadia bacterium]